jgi:CBS-domain-containing membrane protein
MPLNKKVKDLMAPLTDYPHIPYWFTVKQGLAIAKKAALGLSSNSESPPLLVFDEKYELLGSLTVANLIRGIEKKLIPSNGLVSDEWDTPSFIEGRFLEEIREEARKAVSEIMSPVTDTVAPDDSIIKAIYVIMEKNLSLVPVIEKDVIIGIIRLQDIFNELAELVLAEQ